MKRQVLLPLLGMVMMLSCTTITITEQEAFDVKRTIDESMIRDQGVAVQSVNIPTSDGLTLRGWWITRPDARGTVLYFGGNGFVRVASQHIIQAFLNQPVNVLVFDYRGYGQNSGEPSVAGLQRDGEAAYRFLVEDQNIDPDQLLVHGHSLGSFIAAHIATSKSHAGMVLESPITNIQDLTDLLVPWFAEPLVRFDIDEALLENDNEQRMAEYQGPLLVIAGDDDKITPFSMAESLYEIAPSTEKSLVIIEGGSHNDLPPRTEYARALESFYDKVWSVDVVGWENRE